MWKTGGLLDLTGHRRLIIEQPGSAPRVQTDGILTPGAGEVRLDIRATALNFADLLMIEGRYQDTPPFPLTPGLEVSGVVAALGAGVDTVAVGDRVAAQTGGGGLAESVIVAAERLLRLPDAVPDDMGAAFQIAYGTSHLSLVRRARLASGDTLIVLGAAGGVGLTAVEIGKLLGARVIAVARGADRLEICRRHGADVLIDSAAIQDLRAALLEHGRADVLYDSVGGADGTAAQRCLAPEGRHLLIGFARGDLPDLKPNHILVKNLDVIGVNWSHYINHCPDLVRETLTEVAGWIASGRLSPHIGATYSLDDAPAALERLRSRDVTGKIVVTP